MFQQAPPVLESAPTAAATPRAGGRSAAPLDREQRFRLQAAALENTANGVMITDRAGRIVWANPAFERITGYAVEEVLGRTPRFLKSGIQPADFYAHLWKTICAGNIWRGEFTNRHKDGTHFRTEQTITPVRAESGAITHFVGIMNDVTARHEAENGLRQAHRQMQHLLAQTPAVLYAARLDGDRLEPSMVSEGVLPLLGYASEETMNYEWWLAHMHPDDTARAVAAIGETVTRESTRTEYRLRHRDGSYRWVEDSCRLVRDAAGRPEELVGLLTDISERKRAEELLKEVSSDEANPRRNRARRELGFFMGVTAIFATFVAVSDFSAALLAEVFPFHEFVDRSIGVLALMVAGLGVFSYRRWQDFQHQAQRERQAQSALRLLHAELENRVQQRTAELAKANEALRLEAAEREKTGAALQASEERFRQIAETIDEVFWLADVEVNKMSYVSPAYARVWGRSQQSLYDNPRSFVEAIHPEDRPRVLAALHDHKSGRPYEEQYRIVRPDGTERYILDRGFPIRDREGRVTHYAGAAHDVTEREKAKRTLAESERRFQETLANVELIAMTLDQHGRITFCNEYLARLTGWTREELIGREWCETFIPDTNPELRQVFFDAMAAGKIPAHYENPIKTRHGERRDIVWNNTTLRDAAGKVIGTASIAEDVTERRRAEASLRQFAALVESSDDAIVSRNLDGRITSWNPAAQRMFGYPAGEMIGHGIQALLPPESRGEEIEFNVFLRGDSASRVYETRRLRKDGSVVEVAVTISPIHDAAGRINGASEIFRDITERKVAEFRLGLEHAVTEILADGGSLKPTLQQTLQTLGQALGCLVGEVWSRGRSSGTWQCGESWHAGTAELAAFAEVTRQFSFKTGEGLAGRILATGQPDWVADVTSDESCLRRRPAARAGLRSWIGVPLKSGADTVAVMGFFCRDSRPVDARLLSSLAAIGCQVGQFIERQRLAEQVRQAQKLEAIGTLAGGIAHDFNNIIAAITGYTELAKMDLRDRPDVIDHLNAVSHASSRATALVRQILAFSRQQEHERKPIQLRHIVNEAMKLLRATVPTMIEFDLSLPSDTPPVLADASQVHQVVMNLVTNASHAMGTNPGRLGVELEKWQVEKELAQAHPGLRTGEYVRLSISDTGHGMDAATMGRIFDPFFTTKSPGEGTGLGLAVVHGIMQAHEGVVTVYSQPGEGTIFRLYFPALEAVTLDGAAEVAPVPRGRGQRVLLIDDEAPLASLGRKLLERLGYAADAETSAQHALDLVRANPAAYDLVVTDLAMPVLTGTDVAREVKAIRADLPVLLATGYSATLTPLRVQAMGISDLLLKPLSMHALGTAVHRALQHNKEVTHG